MTLPQINQLTAEQEALIQVYFDKWKKVAFSTEPINRELAVKTVKSAYTAIGIEEPRIIFCGSPFLGLILQILWLGSNTPLASQLGDILGNQLGEMYQFGELEKQLSQQIENQINNILLEKIVNLLSQPLINQVDRLQLEGKLLEIQEIEMERIVRGEFLESEKHLLLSMLEVESEAFINSQREYEVDENLLPETTMWQIDGLSQLCILSNYWAARASLFDFCQTVFNIELQPDIWEIYQGIAEHCGFIYPYEKICIICDRPCQLSWDDRERLHAEGQPALQFADGFSLYAYRGVIIPEEYGKIYPRGWQPQWLLLEKNTEIRRALIQGIGYDKICQDLEAIELDCWQEYTLLKIENSVDIEPIYLLKMTCPSTGYIHVLRVPPEMESAKGAIQWVNWGIAPEDFESQT